MMGNGVLKKLLPCTCAKIFLTYYSMQHMLSIFSALALANSKFTAPAPGLAFKQ